MSRSLLLLTVSTAVVFAKSSIAPLTSQAWTSSSSSQETASSLVGRIHAYVSRTTDRRRLAVPEVTANAVRYLQDSAITPPGTNDISQCIDATTVNYDDVFSKAVYGSAYEATCTCVEEDNSIELENSLISLILAPPNNITATPEEIEEWTANFNEQFGGLSGGYDFTCESGCTTCFENNTYCGYLVTEESTAFKGRATDFTFEQIIGGLQGVDPAQVLSDLTFESETCMTYETGETGEVCFIVSFSGDSELSSESLPNCTILYNDEPCNSCESTAVNSNDDTCYVADCTNILPDAMFDSCAETGFVGPFRYLYSLSNQQNAAFTAGTCRSGQPPPEDAVFTEPVTSVNETDVPATEGTEAPVIATPINETEAVTDDADAPPAATNGNNVLTGTAPINETDAVTDDSDAPPTDVAATNGNNSLTGTAPINETDAVTDDSDAKPTGVAATNGNTSSTSNSGAFKLECWSRMMVVVAAMTIVLL